MIPAIHSKNLPEWSPQARAKVLASSTPSPYKDKTYEELTPVEREDLLKQVAVRFKLIKG